MLPEYVALIVLVTFIAFKFATAFFQKKAESKSHKSHEGFSDPDYSAAYSLWHDGYDLKPVQPINFYLRFKSEDGAVSCLFELDEVFPERKAAVYPDEEDWVICLTLTLIPELQVMRDLRKKLEKIAQAYQGVYAHWLPTASAL